MPSFDFDVIGDPLPPKHIRPADAVALQHPPHDRTDQAIVGRTAASMQPDPTTFREPAESR